MLTNSNLIDKINDILFYEWDPIGVAELGGEKDEYMSYAIEIANLISAQLTEIELASYLEHCQKYMLIPPTPEENFKIAKKILSF